MDIKFCVTVINELERLYAEMTEVDIKLLPLAREKSVAACRIKLLEHSLSTLEFDLNNKPSDAK